MSDEKPVLPKRIPGIALSDAVHNGQVGALDLAMAGKLDPEIGRAIIDELSSPTADPEFTAGLDAMLTATGEHLLDELRAAGTPIFDGVAADLADPLTAPIPEEESPHADVP